MKIYIRTYSSADTIRKMPKSLLKFCLLHNFNSRNKRKANGDYTHGHLYSELKEILLPEAIRTMRWRSPEKFACLFYAHDGERGLGWALVTGKGRNAEIDTYVLPRFRRKGVGTRILKKATSVCGPVECALHDDQSRGFYKSLGVTKNDRVTGKRIAA